MMSARSRLQSLGCALWLTVSLACGHRAGDYEATGTVTGVRADLKQVVIDHEDIPGLMPAMTMSFDVADAKLDLARAFGATHTINAATEENVVKAAKKLTGGGPDYCFECIGLGKTVEQAFRSLRKGGKAVVVGVARGEDSVAVKPVSLTFEEKTLTGSYFGSARPREDFPKMLSLYAAGKLKLDELITRRYKIDEAPQAFADLEAGKNARGVIVFD